MCTTLQCSQTSAGPAQWQQNVAPALGKVLQPAALLLLRGALAPLSFFLKTSGGVSMSCNIWHWFDWIKECICPMQSISPSMGRCQSSTSHIAGHATSDGLGRLHHLLWCATGRAVDVTCLAGDPSHLTDEGQSMEVMLQQGLLSQSPFGTHCELSSDAWIQHFPEALPWPIRVRGVDLHEDS